MKKLMNYRPLVIFCVLLVMGIFFSFLCFINPYYAFLFIFPIAIVLYLFFKNKRATVFLHFVAVIIGVLVCVLTMLIYNGKMVEGKYLIMGRVCEEKLGASNNYSYTYLEDVTAVELSTGKTTKLSGKTMVYLNGSSSYDFGDKLTFEGKLESAKLFEENKINTFYYRNNIKYKTSAYGEIVIVDGNKKPTEFFKDKIKDVLYKNLDKDIAGISYAVLFGDTDFIDDDIYDAFINTGTVHTLAVSGLHINFLVVLVLMFLSLCKVKKWYKFGILSTILVLYSYMCGFSPSVVRACIMSITFLLFNSLGKENDSLSAIAFSAIFILIAKPLYIFDYGFLLSYFAVLGIVVLYKPFARLFGESRLGKAVAMLIGLTVCSQIGVLPILSSFGNLQIYSVFANILIVPLFGITYAFLCVAVLLSLIMPFFSFLFVPVSAFFNFMISFNFLVMSLPFAVIKIFSWGALAVIAYYVVLFTITSFVFLKTKIKIITCCALGVIYVTMLIVNNLPAKFNYDSLSVVRNTQVFSIITTKDNGVYLIDLPSTKKEISYLEEYLKNGKIKLSGMILLTDSKTSLNFLDSFLEEYKALVFVRKNSTLGYITRDSKSVVKIEDNEEIKIEENLMLTYYTYFGKAVATHLNLNGKEIMYLDSSASIDGVESAFYRINNLEVLITKNITNNLINLINEKTQAISLEPSKNHTDFLIALNSRKCFVF